MSEFDIVYHGTSKESAADIRKNGIDLSKGDGGYFGWAFYTTADFNLAKCNYSDFFEDGEILTFEVSPNCRLLDLRKEEDFQLYLETQHSEYYGTPAGSLRIFTKYKIDAIYDRSNDSFMVFNPNILTLKE